MVDFAAAASRSWSRRLVLFVYSCGFLIGTYTHAAGLFRWGWLPFPVPAGIGLYWNLLTVLDPLAAALVWWRPRTGVLLAAAIMASDIGVNTYVYLAGCFGPPVAGMVPLSLFEQTLFGLFVFVTAPLIYSDRSGKYSQPAVTL